MLSRIILIFFLISAVASVQTLYSQENLISIKTLNETRQAVPFATVTVIRSGDSSLVARTSTDSAGVAKINLQDGDYLLLITSVDYLRLEETLKVEPSKREFIYYLRAATTLGGVTVTSSRPLIRQEDDKTIVDPGNLVESSTSGYEVIEKTPGLFMDQDGNIYIHSTTPATIMINGREMKMSTAELVPQMAPRCDFLC